MGPIPLFIPANYIGAGVPSHSLESLRWLSGMNVADLYPMAYTYNMYTAIAGQWFEEKGAYWVERNHKAWQKVSDVMETGKYPSWQKEPWLQHGFPMDAVREFLRVCIVDLQ